MRGASPPIPSIYRPATAFTTYSPLVHDTLVLVLSAAFKDRLEGYSWWFPVVGRVPYKGFFDFRGREKSRRSDGRGRL